jgi:hypothetical protein
MQEQTSFINRLAILLFGCLSLYSCTQPKAIIKQVHAYYTERIPGTVQADENGNAIRSKADTVIVVYVEATTKFISWNAAWKNNQAYKIVPHLFDTVSCEAGFKKGTAEKVFITADPQHFLFQLYLQPVELFQNPPKPVDVNQILLRAKYKGKTFLKKTGELTELETYPSS